jgi:hypothetical protein
MIGDRMVSIFWTLVVWVFNNLPWLVIALAAAMALSKRRKSLPLMLQVLGAAGLFLLAAARWLVFWLLGLMGVSYDVLRVFIIIFNFLFVVLFLLFTAGYCWEKFRQWREPPASATAFPVE